MGVTKYVLPVIVGAMSGMILIAGGEWVMHMQYPMPAGTDPYDAVSLAKYIKILPAAAFIIMILNYAICSFLAGIIATLIARRISIKPALVVGIVLTFAGLYNAINMPQPLWVSVISVLVFLPFSYLGYLLARKKIEANNN